MDVQEHRTINGSNPASFGGFGLVDIICAFLGAALYISVIFSALSALPLLYSYIKRGRLLGVLYSLSNLILVVVLAGRLNGAIFFIFAVVLAVVLAEGVRNRLSFNGLLFSAVGMMCFGGIALGVSYSLRNSVSPVRMVHQIVDEVYEHAKLTLEQVKLRAGKSNEISPSLASLKEVEMVLENPDMAKKSILMETPLLIFGVSFLLVLFNIIILVKWNLAGAREVSGIGLDFFRTWRVPELFIWPTLGVLLFLLVEVPWVSSAAVVLAEFLGVLYCLQGLAILSYVFHSWGIRFPLAGVGYLMAIVTFLPFLVLSGFFEFWISFRRKVRR